MDATEKNNGTGAMEARAISKNIRMSARKMRLVVDQIREKEVNEAYSILQFSKKAAALPIDKTLRSAVANAVYRADEQGDVLDVDELYVKEAFIDEGTTLRRYRAAGMGRVSPLRKRTSHVTIVVDTKE
jgi:large subunit ribosomal protein L22